MRANPLVDPCRRLSVAVGLGAALCLAGSAGVRAAPPGGNWPQWRGPQRDGVSSETGLLHELAEGRTAEI